MRKISSTILGLLFFGIQICQATRNLGIEADKKPASVQSALVLSKNTFGYGLFGAEINPPDLNGVS